MHSDIDSSNPVPAPAYLDQLLNYTPLTLDEFMDYVSEKAAPVNRFFANYRCAAMEIETKFKVLNTEFSLKYDDNPIESIKTRIKSYDSIRKALHKNLSPTLASIEENIDDIAGVRVICSFVDDIYVLADCLLQQDDIELLERVDYIKNPKPGGYRSLHLIVTVPIFLESEKRRVKAEVQFRTMAMDFWASLEHKIRYKKDLSPEILSRISNELQETADTSAILDAKMQRVRNMLIGR